MDVTGVLQHLASECGETTQAAIKMIQFGVKAQQPFSDPHKTNQRALEEEIGDVIALATLLEELGVVRNHKITKRVNEKLAKYRRKYN